MASLQEAVNEFLAQKRIAVAGVSSEKADAANSIFRKLRDAGYEVYPTNPRVREVEGTTCYPDIASIPGGVDAVVAVTPPAATLEVARECAALGVRHLWMHRSFGPGSVSEEAVALCREKGVRVIPGGCPMMFCGPVDVGHKCIRWMLKLTGGLPRPA